MEEPLLRVGQRLQVFDGVLGGVAEEGVDVPRLHACQPGSVGNAAEGDPLGLAEHAFLPQHQVQGVVAGAHQGVVPVHRLLHPPQGILVHHLAQQSQLVFQVVVLDVDELHAFLPDAVLFLLLGQHLPQQVPVLLQVPPGQHPELQKEKQHTAQQVVDVLQQH